MTVLLWAVAHNALQVESCSDLDEAAASAWGLNDTGLGSVVGAELLDEERWVSADDLSALTDDWHDNPQPSAYVAKVCLLAPAGAGHYAGKPAPLYWGDLDGGRRTASPEGTGHLR